MGLKNKFFVNVFSNWVGLGINLIISFFLAPFIVKSLGDTLYGIWAIMMQFTGYLMIFDLGIRESVIRYIAQGKARENIQELSQVFNSAIFLYSIIGVVVIIISLLISAYFQLIFNVTEENLQVAKIVVIITGVNVAQAFFFNVYIGSLMGLQRYDVFNKVSVVFALFRSLFIIIFLMFGYKIIALGLIQLGFNFLSNIIIYFKTKKLLPDLRLNPWSGKSRNLKSIGTYSFYVFVNNIGQKIIFYTDAIVIGIFLPAAAITYYAIPGNLIEYMRRIVMTMSQVLNPLTSELDAERDIERIKEIFLYTSKFTLVIGLAIAPVYIFRGETFIELWMGQKYGEKAVVVLIILTTTHLFSLPQYAISNILYGMNKHKIIAMNRVIEATANLLLSIYLVTRLGIEGVALGTAIPHSIVAILILPFFTLKLLKIPLVEYLTFSILPSLLSAIPTITLCIIFEQYTEPTNLVTFFLQVLVTIAVYGITVWFIAFDADMRHMFKVLTRKYLPTRK